MIIANHCGLIGKKDGKNIEKEKEAIGMRNAIVVMILLCVTSVCFAEFTAGEPVQTGDPGTPEQVAPEPYVAPPSEPAEARTTTSSPVPPTPRAAKEKRKQLQQCLRIAIVRHDYRGEQAIRRQIAALDVRLAWVEQNPLGGEAGQQKMWKILHDANVASWGDCRHIAQQEIGAAKAAEQVEQPPASAGTETSPAPATTSPATTTAPAAPAGRSRTMEILGIVFLGGILAAIIVFGILHVTGRNGGRANVEAIEAVLGDQGTRGSDERATLFTGPGGRLKMTVEPANPTPPTTP